MYGSATCEFISHLLMEEKGRHTLQRCLSPTQEFADAVNWQVDRLNRVDHSDWFYHPSRQAGHHSVEVEGFHLVCAEAVVYDGGIRRLLVSGIKSRDQDRCCSALVIQSLSVPAAIFSKLSLGDTFSNLQCRLAQELKRVERTVVASTGQSSQSTV